MSFDIKSDLINYFFGSHSTEFIWLVTNQDSTYFKFALYYIIFEKSRHKLTWQSKIGPKIKSIKMTSYLHIKANACCLCTCVLCVANCCCWCASVCFIKTILILCSIAYFLATKKFKSIMTAYLHKIIVNSYLSKRCQIGHYWVLVMLHQKYPKPSFQDRKQHRQFA